MDALPGEFQNHRFWPRPFIDNRFGLRTWSKFRGRHQVVCQFEYLYNKQTSRLHAAVVQNI